MLTSINKWLQKICKNFPKKINQHSETNISFRNKYIYIPTSTMIKTVCVCIKLKQLIFTQSSRPSHLLRTFIRLANPEVTHCLFLPWPSQAAISSVPEQLSRAFENLNTHSLKHHAWITGLVWNTGVQSYLPRASVAAGILFCRRHSWFHQFNHFFLAFSGISRA